MKKILLLISLTLTFSACAPTPLANNASAVAESTPIVSPIAPNFEILTNPTLTQLDMIDTQNGWAQAEGMILRTENGGKSWLNVTPKDIYNNPAYAKSVFLAAQIGWVLIEDIDSSTVATIYHTADGGTTWRWRNTPFGRSELGFIDLENGYALTGLGAAAGSMGVAIWQTQNGGGDWARTFLHDPGLNDSLPFSGIKNGIAFRDPLNGWVGGSIPMDGVIWLYRSVDGGFSWMEQKVDLPSGYQNYQTSTSAPLFFDDGSATLPVQLHGERSGYVFYHSADAGETWASTLPIQMSGRYAVASANEIIVWDGGKTIYATSDAGATWSFYAPNWQPRDLLIKLDFVSVNEGWALTEDSLYRTQDGGKTWEKLGQ